MTNPLAVTILDNGPLKISSNSINLRYCGEAISVESGKDIYLCRCGESKKPPFCDGNHAKTGFVGESELREKREIRVWEGRNIRTFFNPNACMHVSYCKPLAELRQRELDGDDQVAGEIATVVESCPSGALSYEAPKLPQPDVPIRADIDIIEGGELRIQCRFEINRPLQERQCSERATLCRCGLSTNKPWCDGRHKKRKDFR